MILLLKGLILGIYTILVSFSSMMLFFVLDSLLFQFIHILLFISSFNIVLSLIIIFPLTLLFDVLEDSGAKNEK